MKMGRTRRIRGRQCAGPGGSGPHKHDRMDQGPRWCGPGGEDPTKRGLEKERLEEARTRRAKIQASTDLKSKGPRKRGPRGHRSTQARAGRIKVWVRVNQSATKVSRSTGESKRGGQVERRGPPEANKGEWKQLLHTELLKG